MLKLTSMKFDEEEYLNGVREDAREEGIKEGEEKGIGKIVRYMLSAGKSVDSISEDTGLTKDEVLKIANEYNE